MQTKTTISSDSMTEQIFAKRLVNARKIRCLSQRELCDRLDGLVSSNAIAKYETGKMLPSSTVLIALARALSLELDYFFRPFTISVDETKFEFRKKSSLNKKAENAVKEYAIMQIEKYLEIEQVTNDGRTFDIDYRSDIVHDSNDARALANRLREDLELGIDGIPCPLEILENRGVKVIEVDADEKFDGSCVTDFEIPIIILNARITSERKRLTLFHELAHLILRFAEDVNVEALCNIFANEVLLPSHVLKQLIGERRKNISLVELKDIQRKYGISAEAIMVKAKQLGIITESCHRSFCIKQNTNEAFKDEVRKSVYPDENATRFKRIVYKALSDDLITASKAAMLLTISVDEVIEHVNVA